MQLEVWLDLDSFGEKKVSFCFVLFFESRGLTELLCSNIFFSPIRKHISSDFLLLCVMLPAVDAQCLGPLILKTEKGTLFELDNVIDATYMYTYLHINTLLEAGISQANSCRSLNNLFCLIITCSWNSLAFNFFFFCMNQDMYNTKWCPKFILTIFQRKNNYFRGGETRMN